MTCYVTIITHVNYYNKMGYSMYGYWPVRGDSLNDELGMLRTKRETKEAAGETTAVGVAAEPPALGMRREWARPVPCQICWGLPRSEACSLVTSPGTMGRA